MSAAAQAAPGRPDAPRLLLTKLHSPGVSAQVVARDRLFERLDEGRLLTGGTTEREIGHELFLCFNGLIERVQDLGLELVSVNPLHDPRRP